MRVNFMLVDDNEIDLFVNQKYIEKIVEDAEIITFIRAKKAIEYLESMGQRSNADFKFIPDIILLDINMPEMNGFEFLDEFSGLDSEVLRDIRIYLLSSSTNIKDVMDADRHKACSGFITKPLTGERVQQMINDVSTKIVQK
ncbi:response regulator [Allomuricauda sp. M10]|uniref:response regulator n=1 Tax=Allomuricauda sp. M10 TaxID=2683292 RepID=UPI001D1816C5|nr:response regulator [Muricauda sp. M10]